MKTFPGSKGEARDKLKLSGATPSGGKIWMAIVSGRYQVIQSTMSSNGFPRSICVNYWGISYQVKCRSAASCALVYCKRFLRILPTLRMKKNPNS